MMHWDAKRVTILGGARQGQAAARWLARHGAIVTINDRRLPAEMVAAQAALAGLPVRWVLGDHPLDLLGETDVLCISGGIPLTLSLVVAAQQSGIPLTNDTQLFLEAVPCQTIGITGSAGKTTTTTLVGRIAKAARGRKAYVGGNIGDPLLNYVDEMPTNALAVLEISSFQLEQMTRSPQVAAILNITPNHLDRHGTMEAYTAAKARLIEFQAEGDTAILGHDDPVAWGLREQVHGRLFSFGLAPLPSGSQGTFVRDGQILLQAEDQESVLLPLEIIRLRGAHNQLNVLAACAIACAAGLPARAVQAGVEGFNGVAHRLEYVRSLHGVTWYNDSIATAPERTSAAIRSFSEPIILLLGGRDKDLPWGELAELVSRQVDHVVLFGEAAGKIEAALKQASGPGPQSLERCPGLEEAVQAAARVAQPGDVVLLSPGGTSFDQFSDFEERGEAYCKWVSTLS